VNQNETAHLVFERLIRTKGLKQIRPEETQPIHWVATLPVDFSDLMSEVSVFSRPNIFLLTIVSLVLHSRPLPKRNYRS
jgi:hypothetical protein